MLLFFLASICPVQAADPRANPFAAHNAYPWRLYPKDRFDRALAAGLKHIEIDVTYDPARRAVVATHDARPTGNEPELATLIAPLWEKWSQAADDGYTLIIDFKIGGDEIVRGVKQILDAHRELLSSLPKRPGASFQPGKITVCFTGNGAENYEPMIADGESYLGFTDVTGCPGSWQVDPAAYVPKQPAGFARFITLEKQNFMDAPGARGDEHVSLDRLKEVARLAAAGGYRLRIYTVNPKRAADGSWDTRSWDPYVEAGVPMIATDAYDVARDYWLERAKGK